MLLVCNRHMRDIHPAVEETENLDQLLFVGHLIDQDVVSDYRVANRVIIDQIAGTVRKSIWAGADAGNLLLEFMIKIGCRTRIQESVRNIIEIGRAHV